MKGEYVEVILARYLREKYQGIEFDFIVGWGFVAATFLSTNSRLFANAHRVYIEAAKVENLLEGGSTGKETIIGIDND